MLERVLKTTADEIRAVIGDLEAYPYNDDLPQPIGDIIQAQPPDIAALLAAFVDCFRPVYSSSEYMTHDVAPLN